MDVCFHTHLGFVSSLTCCVGEGVVPPHCGEDGDFLSIFRIGAGELARSRSSLKSTFKSSGRFRLELPERARRAQDRSR